MSDYHINIFYSDEDGGYIADIPDLPSCSAFVNGPQEIRRHTICLHGASVVLLTLR